MKTELPQADPSKSAHSAQSVQPPHPPLQQYYTDEADRRTYLDHGFDVSARYYDGISRLMAFGTDRWYRRQALLRAGLTAGMAMVDVGCGTGLSAGAALDIIGPHGSIVGVDPSLGMLTEAVQQKRFHAGVRGLAESLPLRDNQFDFLGMSFALRHVADLQLAFREFQRVLKPGGVILITEMTLPPTGLSYWFLRCYIKYMVPFFSRILSGSRETQQLYRYCWDTHDYCVPPETIEASLHAVGLEDVQRWVDVKIFSQYTARKPAE